MPLCRIRTDPCSFLPPGRTPSERLLAWEWDRGFGRILWVPVPGSAYWWEGDPAPLFGDSKELAPEAAWSEQLASQGQAPEAA